MRYISSVVSLQCAALATLVSGVLTPAANAQDKSADRVLEEIIVTGSRIRRDPLNESAAIMDIGSEDLNQTGVTNLGDILQNLPISGSAPNSKFNVPGNVGFPQDGSGISAGAVQLSLRNIDARRTLILVDGKRWVAGASASGVPGTVDLNTLPANVIKRIEILQDGASAIYGSDAIGGVVNVITDSRFEGFRLDAQTGQYLSSSDGDSSKVAALWGGGNDTTHVVMSLSYTDEKAIETADRSLYAYPHVGATSCSVPDTRSRCSSFTPQARFVLGPNFGYTDITLNDGVLNDGMGNIPVFDPLDPFADDFHQFTVDDRYNFNGPGLNYLRTPNERVNFYSSAIHEFSEWLSLVAKGSYTNRTSATRAAPEPLCVGNGCDSQIGREFFISALNPYNPFGVDLSAANGNMEFFARRPLESAPRRFVQDVNTYFVSVGLEGRFEAGQRTMFWDLTTSYGDNAGFQQKYGAHNLAKLQVAMGDPAVCAATPNCVPFNFFGGQGPNGEGSITEEMLDFVGFVQRDYSEQTLKDISLNISGDLVSLPAGELAFAAGFEYREHEGSYQPDPVAESGETAGVPAGSTAGYFDVSEFYSELNVPLIAGAKAADYLEMNVAARYSDYSTSGAESTYKAGLLWRPFDSLSVRGSFSTGFRAPGIGELFGGAALQGFLFEDPCTDYTAIVGTANGGRDTAQSPTIQQNCAALGVAPGLAYPTPGASAISQGNEALIAETSKSWSAGFVWSPGFAQNAGWTEGITFSLDLFNLEIDDAVQGRDPAEVIIDCVDTLDALFCDAVLRGSSSRVDLVNNQLRNIGSIETAGFDIALDYVAPDTVVGQFNVRVDATYLDKFVERTSNTDGSFISNERAGTHTLETFARAFPEWRAVTNVNWNLDRWSANLVFRWADEMVMPNDCIVNSALFTDLQVRYLPGFANDAFTLTAGFNNLFDEQPANLECGIGGSPVLHDLPGTVGYFRLTYQRG